MATNSNNNGGSQKNIQDIKNCHDGPGIGVPGAGLLYAASLYCTRLYVPVLPVQCVFPEAAYNNPAPAGHRSPDRHLRYKI